MLLKIVDELWILKGISFPVMKIRPSLLATDIRVCTDNEYTLAYKLIYKWTKTIDCASFMRLDRLLLTVRHEIYFLLDFIVYLYPQR